MSAATIVAGHRRNRPDGRFALWVVAAAFLALAAGFGAALLLLDESAGEVTPPQLLSFRKLDVQTSGGLMVLSFDLATEQRHAKRVERARAALDARFREVLAGQDLDRLYSRDGKEALAATLRAAANRELGTAAVDAIYFGDFKLYHSLVSAPR